MPGQPLSLCQPATYGCNTADEPVAAVDGNAGKFIQLTGNLRIHNGRWRTAYRWRELQGHGEALELWQSLHTQNAIWYLPRAGQGTHYLGVGNPRIIESAAGRLFSLEINNGMFEVKDVSGGNTSYPWYMLAWLCQGENYVVRTDGKSQTQIYDGKNPVFFSNGYNRLNKTTSQFPNFAGPTVYAGGRFWTTLFGRRLYASNSLHQLNQESAIDLISFTDQTYDYINVYFAPPADDGDISSLMVSVNAGFNESRAQGEVLSNCDGPSIWGVQIGIPREQWPIATMRHSRSKETAAAGPNAFHVRDGDILMRTAKGLESINLLTRERNTLGNPSIDLGADLKALFERDDEQLLLFASLINPPRWNRLICTITPQVKEARHWHLGYVSANFNPMGQRVPQSFAWEGLGTIPKKMGRIVQFLHARIDGKSEVAAILDKNATSKGLALLTLEEGQNLFADGTSQPVQWFILTKRITTGGTLKDGTFGHAWLRLDDINSDVDIEVFARVSSETQFRKRRIAKIKVNANPDDGTGCAIKSEKKLCLGTLLSDHAKYSWAQFLIKGTGICTVDFAIRPDQAGEPDEDVEDECIEIVSEPPCDFDPFYSALAET